MPSHTARMIRRRSARSVGEINVSLRLEADSEIAADTAGIAAEGQSGFRCADTRGLARRIDEGYSIEVRAFVPPDEEDEGEAPDGVTDDVVQAARAITDRQPRMRRMNLTGRPILELPEGYEEEVPPQEETLDPPAG
jgi:hypothetical protein